MGHEMSAIVTQTPRSSRLTEGDMVYVMPYLSCGRCVACRLGRTNCCVELEVLGVHRDGALTEYLSVPERFVHKAEGLTLDQAAMIEFLAIGAHAVRRAQVREGQRVLVVGAGPIGMGAIIFARLHGATGGRARFAPRTGLAFASGCSARRRAWQVGADDADRLAAPFGTNEFYDVVFDATGNPAAMERGFRFRCARRHVRADLGGVGGHHVQRPRVPQARDHAARQPQRDGEDFETVVAAMRDGRVPAGLNTHRMALVDVPEKFRTLLDRVPGVVKAIVEC
jgi:threonine dehydrogenase-like Zn-dependent dehydrogenase